MVVSLVSPCVPFLREIKYSWKFFKHLRDFVKFGDREDTPGKIFKICIFIIINICLFP